MNTEFDQLWEDITKDTAGLVTKAEMKLLFDLIRENEQIIHTGVEIGSLFGLSSAIIATALKGKPLYCIENFAVQGSDAEPFFKEKTMKRFPNITLIQKSSDAAAVDFLLPYEFIFIDGDHQDDGIQRDLKNWMPRLRSGTFVAFHDYHNYMFPAIARRVEEVTQNWAFVSQVDSLLVKRKP